MFKLYGVNASPYVRKVRVVLAEKGVDYELEPVLPFNVTDEFKKMSPLGKIPVLQDGDRILPDSSVICAYVERLHPAPALYPADAFEYGRALWFEEYSDTALVTVMGPKIFLPLIVAPRFFGKAPDVEGVERVAREELPPLFGYLESQLGDGWLAGANFSIADIAVGSPFVNLRHAGYGVDAARWPKLAAYVGRVHARPSFTAVIDEETAMFGRAA